MFVLKCNSDCQVANNCNPSDIIDNTSTTQTYNQVTKQPLFCSITLILGVLACLSVIFSFLATHVSNITLKISFLFSSAACFEWLQLLVPILWLWSNVSALQYVEHKLRQFKETVVILRSF